MALGLESLFENGGPVTSAITRGQREALAQTQGLQNILKGVQDYERAEEMNPLDISHRRGQVAAQVPELEKASAEAKLASGTVDSSIKAKNSANLTSITKDQAERISQMGAMAGQLGAILSNVPEGLPRQQAAVQWMTQNGVPPDSVAGKYILNNPPEKLMEVSQKISKLRDSYIQALGVSEQAGKNQLDGIRATGEETRKTRKMEIDAGRYSKSGQGIKSIEDQIKAGKLTYEKAATLLYGAAQFEADPVQQEKYMQMAQTYETMGIRAKQAMGEGKIDVNAVTGLPTRTVPPVTGQPQGPGPAPAKHSLSDVQKMYPGVPPEKIREAYKKKFGVDLQ